jgi:hypothetical protein
VSISPLTVHRDVLARDPTIRPSTQSTKAFSADFNQGGECGQAHVIVTGLLLSARKPPLSATVAHHIGRASDGGSEGMASSDLSDIKIGLKTD